MIIFLTKTGLIRVQYVFAISAIMKYRKNSTNKTRTIEMGTESTRLCVVT